MTEKYAIKQDLREVEAMAEAFEHYVRTDEIYGQVGGGMFGSGNMPALTTGSLLMRLRRLKLLQDNLNDKQIARLEKAQHQHDAVYKEWRVHYEQKLIREALSRLKSMYMYFGECQENPRLCASAYQPEAFKRTIVEEIRKFMQNNDIHSAELESAIRQTDSKLHEFVKPSAFIWSDTLQAVYDSSNYWWLYNHPVADSE